MKHTDITIPTGGKLTIRESTGQDDDILSNVYLDEAGIINKYLANIIVKGLDGKKPTEDDIERFTLRDKYTVLIKSRIHSLGKNLIFKYKWEASDTELDYEVDLSDYVWDDYSKFPEKDSEDYFQERIAPYKVKSFELNIGDKELRMKLLDGVGERLLMETPENQRTINKQLTARALEMHHGDKWLPVTNFGAFSSRELVQLRALYETNDPDLQGLVKIDNPQSGESIELSLIGIKDFYFPVRI